MPRAKLPTSEEKEAFVKEMFDTISPSYDKLNRLMTFRLDQLWRRQSIKQLGLQPPATLLDLACGTGDFVKLARSQEYRCVGTDFSFGMISHSRLKGDLAIADALNLPFANESFDGVTCGFALRNFVALPPVFSELARVLRPGGRIALLEVAQPSSRLLRAGHSLYFNKVVPFVGGLLSDKGAYSYLPASVSYLPPTTSIVEMLANSGFSQVKHTLLTIGAAQLFTATRT